MMRIFFLMTIVLSSALACKQPPNDKQQPAAQQPTAQPALLQLTDKQKVTAVISGLNAKKALPEIAFAERFKHHIVNVEQGKTAFLKHLQSLQRTVTPVRFIEEHEYVIAHCREQLDSAQFISFLVFRFENGHLAEYWENRQSEVTKTKSGRSMIDGPVTPKNLDQTEYNKALIRRYFLDINYIGKMERLPTLINAKKYHQHNPYEPDGLKHLAKLIDGKKRRTVPYCKLRLLLGQGDMVFTIWDYPKNEELVIVHELWRVQNNQIVEHWDVISK